MSDPGILAISERAVGITPDRDGFARLTVDTSEWCALARGCAAGKHDLVALWADADHVRAAFLTQPGTQRAIVSIPLENDGSYPSVGQYHAPAIRLERTMRDLNGVTPRGLPDTRSWIDHGTWPHSTGTAAQAYAFLPVEGSGLHQIPVGPVHAGIIEPGHFRFTANGETVARLEERLGYVHKGIEALVVGKTIDEAARVVARASGDSTVALSFAFARAVESAAAFTAPPRAMALRAIMAELERIAHHVNDFGAICNDTSAVAIQAHCTLLREKILQFCHAGFGHRLMMDRIVPGGVASDLSDTHRAELRTLLVDCETQFRRLVRVYDNSPSIQDRTVTTGHLDGALAARFAAGGFVGRASGRDFDCRRDTIYAPYDEIEFSVPLRTDGDVNARAWIRIEEVGQSISIIRQLLDRLPSGPLHTDPPEPSGSEGAALAEAFRGDVFVAIRVDQTGHIARCHIRDASSFQWPLLEAAIEGNIVADFPVCNKSFNCSYSGHDL
jgi:Ni,Fe-hydrogenase III large subunit